MKHLFTVMEPFLVKTKVMCTVIQALEERLALYGTLTEGQQKQLLIISKQMNETISEIIEIANDDMKGNL